MSISSKPIGSATSSFGRGKDAVTFVDDDEEQEETFLVSPVARYDEARAATDVTTCARTSGAFCDCMTGSGSVERWC